MELRPLQQQTVKLKMTAELRQAISILQFSSQELADFIHEQALENPLIELKEPMITISDNSSPRNNGMKKQTIDPIGLIENDEKDLKDDLLQQARWLNLDDELFKTISMLIFQLDDDGYLREELEDLTEQFKKPYPKLLQALECLQSLEPSGVGARNLEECLLLQLERKRPKNRIALELISNHLVDVARGDLEGLRRQLNVPQEDIQSAISLIQTLNPKPGITYTKGRPEYIRPDVVVEKKGSRYDVWLVDYTLPTLHVNHEYDHLLKSTAKNETTHYIQQKHKQFLWLVKSIEQRKTTLLNVTRSMMNKQRRFLEWGPKAMAPLTLRDIADELEIHESTVSRAVKQKYIQTPYGIFELKSFFVSKIKTSGLSDISSTSVKMFIQEFVEQEDQVHPLSDQNIADILKKTKGIDVSRRAIAKYRTELKIPSSTKRKNLMKTWPSR